MNICQIILTDFLFMDFSSVLGYMRPLGFSKILNNNLFIIVMCKSLGTMLIICLSFRLDEVIKIDGKWPFTDTILRWKSASNCTVFYKILLLISFFLIFSHLYHKQYIIIRVWFLFLHFLKLWWLSLWRVKLILDFNLDLNLDLSFSSRHQSL